MTYYRGQAVYYDNAQFGLQPYDSYPTSHTLTKNIGDTVTASWAVRNVNASAVKYAQLQLQIGAQAVVKGAHFSIQPNAVVVTLPAIVSTITAWASSGTGVSAILNMVETNSGGSYVATIGSHPFLITAGQGGAGLEAVGDPSIV